MERTQLRALCERGKWQLGVGMRFDIATDLGDAHRFVVGLMPLRLAALARSQSIAFGSVGIAVEADIFGKWQPRRTRRSALHAGRAHPLAGPPNRHRHAQSPRAPPLLLHAPRAYPVRSRSTQRRTTVDI